MSMTLIHGKKILLQILIVSSFVLLITGCAHRIMYEKFSGAKFTEYNLTEQDIEEMQFYVEAPIILRDANLPEANKAISTRKSKKGKKDLIVIDEKTSGVLSDIGDGWVDIDFGEGIILRFEESDPGQWYRLTLFNGQKIEEGERINYNGKTYIVAYRHIPSAIDEERYFSEIPYLYFDLERFLRLNRSVRVVKGKKLN